MRLLRAGTPLLVHWCRTNMFYWRSSRTFIEAWSIEEVCNEDDVANAMDVTSFPRRNSCPGPVTLWEQPCAAERVVRTVPKKDKIKKKNNQRQRKAAKKFHKWIVDWLICPWCKERMWTGGPGANVFDMSTDGSGEQTQHSYYKCTECKRQRHSSSSYYCAFCDVDICIECVKKAIRCAA